MLKQHGQTALHLSALGDRAKEAACLLEAGANVDATDWVCMFRATLPDVSTIHDSLVSAQSWFVYISI